MFRFLLRNLEITTLVVLEKKSSVLCFGGSTLGSHLFPFRTEKLSLIVAMIVPWSESS